MQDDQTAKASEGESAQPAFDRRRGPRRGSNEQIDQPFERRGPDRRRKKPGLAGLFGALLSDEDDELEAESGETAGDAADPNVGAQRPAAPK